MEFIGLVLLVLAVCLVAVRPKMLKTIGYACLNGLYEAGKWYAAPYQEMTEATAAAQPEQRATLYTSGAEPTDLADVTETEFTARLLQGTIPKADYHAAMTELARLDADRHPVSIPPTSDC